MLQTLKYLIRQKTITEDKRKNYETLKWIKNSLAKKLQTKILQSNGFYSLIATTKNTKHPKVWLAAHLDVVPGSNKAFMPKIEKGRICGRGAFDMKFAIAAYMNLVKEIKNPKEHDFGIMLTSDEEIGGKNGTGFILKQGYKGKIAFLPDGCAPESIEKASKGAWHLEIEAKGASAHGSRPWAGKNAIGILLCFLHDLENIIPGESCSCDGSHYHDTLNIGKISGGEAINKVADKAKAHIDIRHIPETSKNILWEKIKTLGKTHKITIKELVYSAPAKTDFTNKEIQLFEKIYKNVTKHPLKRTISHGASDAHYFYKKGIPVLLAQPKGGNHHTEHEWVDIQGLETYCQVLKHWLLEVTKIPKQ